MFIQPGFGPENVAGLREAFAAVAHFELLRGLTSGGELDFQLRFAAVADLVHADQTLWNMDALERRFAWMDPDRRYGVVRALRRSGWLETVGQAYRLTSDGLAVYATLSRLSSLKTGRNDDLAMGVFDLEASARLGEDTGPAMRHLQHHLRRAIEDVEAAVDSQSEVMVEDARDKMDQNLAWSARARQLLDTLDIDEDQSYRAGQRLGRDLSEMHRWHSVMQRTLDQIGQSRVPVSGMGLRPADIDRYLASMEPEALAQLADGVLNEPVWPLVGILDNLLLIAEHELLFGEDRSYRTVGWSDGVGEVAEVGEPPPSEGELAFHSFERRLEGLVRDGNPIRLDRFTLAGSFPKSCYRMTLLSLEDEKVDGRATVEIEPGLGVGLYSDFASEVSKGRIIPRSAAAGDA